MVLFRVSVAAAILCLLAGCAHVRNLPINQPTGDPDAGLGALNLGRPSPASEDDLMIGLAFSGGGTRAAAFSHGVLKALAERRIMLGGKQVSLLERIDFITGVSGGSVAAAYFGLKRHAALEDFRERFLLRDAEASLRTTFTLVNLSRAIAGGVNEDVRLRAWLDENLFEGATFAALLQQRRPRIWINATDIYNRTPFVFGKTAFSAICSDLAEYPVAGAVAASAAVPVAFAPVILETFPERCNAKLPAWIERARNNPDALPLLRAFALGVGRYHDGSMRYIKLLDGGLVDNFGLSGFTIARESAQTPYGPLSPEQAVRLRRILFLVVDAGRGPSGDWTQQLEGPSGLELVMAVTDSALDAGTRASFTAFETTMQEWRAALVRWRCGLPPTEVARLRGTASGWRCDDLRLHIGRIGFDLLSAERTALLNRVPTRFYLPIEVVDEVIAAGGEALRASPAYKAFLKGL
jgi:NTE family protein